MDGIEAYLSYASKVGMLPELHYPFMRVMKVLSRGRPGGPLLPVIEVLPSFGLCCFAFAVVLGPCCSCYRVQGELIVAVVVFKEWSSMSLLFR